MIREQKEDRADRELGEVDVAVSLDEADLLRHLGQLEAGVALDEGEGPLLLPEALLGEGREAAVDEKLIPLFHVAQDSGHHSSGDVGLRAGSQLPIRTFIIALGKTKLKTFSEYVDLLPFCHCSLVKLDIML